MWIEYGEGEDAYTFLDGNLMIKDRAGDVVLRLQDDGSLCNFYGGVQMFFVKAQ